MVLKKGWLSEFEIVEICGQVHCVEYEQEQPTLSETQSNENRKTTDFITTKQMFTQKRQNKYRVNKEIHD